MGLIPKRQFLFSQQRILLLVGSGLLFVVPLMLFKPAAYWASDPELFRLLRGMGILKIVLAVLALAVVWWRLGRPVLARLQAVFVGGVWALSLAAGLIWQLHAVLPASGLFHVATIALLIAAWRDTGPRVGQRRAAACELAGVEILPSQLRSSRPAQQDSERVAEPRRAHG